MVNKKDFLKQVKELKTTMDLQDFELLYAAYKDKKKDKNILDLVDKLVSDLFTLNAYYNAEPLIPYTFFDTPIGKVILDIRYGVSGERLYYVSDLAEIMGITKQAVTKKIQNGEIVADKPCRDWIIKEKDLNDYLTKTGKEPIGLYGELEEEFITPNEEREEQYSIERR